MQSVDQLNGIIRARAATARSLAQAIDSLPAIYSERELADRWIAFLSKDQSILPYGWYQPPPQGVSVLIGSPPTYGRLRYKSLRSSDNFPSQDHKLSSEAVVYPYFSAVDRDTLMIGDHVATYYAGKSKDIQDWMTKAYAITRNIADKAAVGMKLSELYNLAKDAIDRAGLNNNTFSQSGGLAADVGHTVPFFGSELPIKIHPIDQYSQRELAQMVAQNRTFVGANSVGKISENFAFTIEPQLLAEGYPMASFHIIIVFCNREKFVIEKFRDLFDRFGMSEWIYRQSKQSDLA